MSKENKEEKKKTVFSNRPSTRERAKSSVTQKNVQQKVNYKKNQKNKGTSLLSNQPSFGDKKKKEPRVRVRVKQAIKENAYVKPKIATKNSRKTYQHAKKQYKLKKEEVREKERILKAYKENAPGAETNFQKAYESTKDKVEGAALRSKIAKNESATELKVARKVFKRAKHDDPTRLVNKTKQAAKTTSIAYVRHQTEKSVAQDDILGEAISIRRKSRQRTHTYQSAKFLVKGGHRVNVRMAKGTYGLTNRSYNFVRGRGFQKTPVDHSKARQAAKKFRNFKNRLKMSKVGKAASTTTKVTGGLVRFFNAPLKLKNATIIGGVLLVMMFLFALFSSMGPTTIHQDEFELTDSWTHMTKEDAEHTDDTHLFYTQFDDVMFYMNYAHEDYKLTDKIAWYRFKTYAEYLSDLWVAMNGKKGNYDFTSMDDLIKDKKSDYHLDPEDYEEFRELVDELGYGVLNGTLSFPFETDNLLVSRRYGFEVNGENLTLHENIQIQTSERTEITAPMSGVIEWHLESNQVIIQSDNDARLILTGINSQRHRSGSEVMEGEAIGRASGNSMTISYEKYDTEDKVWRRVNPAFYFPKVSYLQVTVITENFNPEGDRLKNARFIHTQLKNLGYTDKGIAAILGNFDVESSINPKRAEGDYLSPPVGASANSWDDPNWLSMGGMEIYGMYPNILRRGLGLGQWTDTADGSTRHTRLRSFASQKNTKWYSLPLQLDFMLNGDVPAYRTIFRNTAKGLAGESVADLTRYFLVQWEGNPGDKLQERIQSAENWYQYFTRTGGTGDYILPIDPPNISSWFGNRYLNGELNFHRGIDFAHPQGTPIKAIADGVVIASEYHSSWGNYVRIKHANGHCSLYAHNVRNNVKVGDTVKQGDIIGLVGNTGNSFGAHLHFEYSTSTDLSQSSLMDPAIVLGISK